jgi:hypothetical protein
MEWWLGKAILCALWWRIKIKIKHTKCITQCYCVAVAISADTSLTSSCGRSAVSKYRWTLNCSELYGQLWRQSGPVTCAECRIKEPLLYVWVSVSYVCVCVCVRARSAGVSVCRRSWTEKAVWELGRKTDILVKRMARVASCLIYRLRLARRINSCFL